MDEFHKITLKLGHKNTNPSSLILTKKDWEKLTPRNWNIRNEFSKQENARKAFWCVHSSNKKIIFTFDLAIVFWMLFTSEKTPLLLVASKCLLIAVIQLTKYSCHSLDQNESTQNESNCVRRSWIHSGISCNNNNHLHCWWN